MINEKMLRERLEKLNEIQDADPVTGVKPVYTLERIQWRTYKNAIKRNNHQITDFMPNQTADAVIGALIRLTWEQKS